MRSLIAVLLMFAATAAEAGIVCRDGYQIVHGRAIATPYCDDNYVAAIARKHGFNVSDAEIRNSPAKKRQVCRFIGDNIEVQESCADYTDPWGR